ncbi:MAG: PilZ domain-containing protein [Pseudomonadota bacterium]
MMKNPDVDQAVEDSLRVLQGLSKEEQEIAATPPAPLPVFVAKLPRANVRTHKRYLVKWRMAIVYEGGNGKKTFHGRVNDISLGGLSIHCDHNVFYEGKVILLLALPPLNAGSREKILEISCRMNYTILSQQLFRIGLEFLEFRKGDKKLLEERLEISNAGGMAYMDM